MKSKAKLIKTPILYSHGDTDPINSYASTSKAYEITASEDKELKTWPGLFHECKMSLKKKKTPWKETKLYLYHIVHNEKLPERQQVAEYYVNWIKKHSSNNKTV